MFLYSIRSLQRAPPFTMVAILSLGLGIGSATAVFAGEFGSVAVMGILPPTYHAFKNSELGPLTALGKNTQVFQSLTHGIVIAGAAITATWSLGG
jgi:hypothetical protein